MDETEWWQVGASGWERHANKTERWWLVGGRGDACALISLDGEPNTVRADINVFRTGGVPAVFEARGRSGIRIVHRSALPERLYEPSWYPAWVKASKALPQHA